MFLRVFMGQGWPDQGTVISGQMQSSSSDPRHKDPKASLLSLTLQANIHQAGLFAKLFRLKQVGASAR